MSALFLLTFKVETLKSLFQVLVKGDLRDAACSPLQMVSQLMIKLSFRNNQEIIR